MYDAMVSAWLGGLPRAYQQIASFVDAKSLELAGLVEG